MWHVSELLSVRSEPCLRCEKGGWRSPWEGPGRGAHQGLLLFGRVLFFEGVVSWVFLFRGNLMCFMCVPFCAYVRLQSLLKGGQGLSVLNSTRPGVSLGRGCATVPPTPCSWTWNSVTLRTCAAPEHGGISWRVFSVLLNFLIVTSRAEGSPAEEEAAGRKMQTRGEHWQRGPDLEQRDFAQLGDNVSSEGGHRPAGNQCSPGPVGAAALIVARIMAFDEMTSRFR